jgi:hypothetical protein
MCACVSVPAYEAELNGGSWGKRVFVGQRILVVENRCTYDWLRIEYDWLRIEDISG